MYPNDANMLSVNFLFFEEDILWLYILKIPCIENNYTHLHRRNYSGFIRSTPQVFLFFFHVINNMIAFYRNQKK